MITRSFSCRLWGGVTALALCATLGQAQFLDHNDLRTAIGTSTTSGTVTLPFDNFYVRTRVNYTVGAGPELYLLIRTSERLRARHFNPLRGLQCHVRTETERGAPAPLAPRRSNSGAVRTHRPVSSFSTKIQRSPPSGRGPGAERTG